MALYLVRHAKAGSRSKWDGPDELRPLTRSGREQADALARRLDGNAGGRLVSSPYTRCVQTLEPLALKLGVEVEVDAVLAEGSRVVAVIDLLLALPDRSVLCSHGDVIPDTLDALLRRGMVLGSQPDWRKASTWVLERDGDQIVRGVAEPPPGAPSPLA